MLYVHLHVDLDKNVLRGILHYFTLYVYMYMRLFDL